MQRSKVESDEEDFYDCAEAVSPSPIIENATNSSVKDFTKSVSRNDRSNDEVLENNPTFGTPPDSFSSFSKMQMRDSGDDELLERTLKLQVNECDQDNNVDQDVPKEELTEEEKKEMQKEALRMKELGNDEFRKKMFAEAEQFYSEGLRICPDCFTTERSMLFSNRSACLFHLNKKENAIEDCSEALKLNPTYLKPLLRRAQLNEECDKLDEALEDYKKVVEIDPSNQLAKSACIKLPSQIEARNEKLKTEMIGNLKDLGNKILGKFGLSTDNFQLQQNAETGSYNIQFNQNP